MTTIVRPGIAPPIFNGQNSAIHEVFGPRHGCGYARGGGAGGRDFRGTCRGFRGGGAVTPGNRARNIPEKVKANGLLGGKKIERTRTLEVLRPCALGVLFCSLVLLLGFLWLNS